MMMPAAGVSAANADEPPVIAARAYLLMDMASGQVLYAHEGETQLPMASTTKIMTAILALERGKLTDIVTAGQRPYDTGGSTIYLDLGEQQPLENLLYALMLESANDAAVAIAEHLAGTEEQFAAWMNAKAREIGATQTHFVNSHGLHDPNHYTTAKDLALIARYAMQNPAFRSLVLVEEKEVPGFKDNPPRKMFSRNQLLGYYEGVTGVKNGFTEEALLTNVASAKRGDTELIAVILGAQSMLWTSSIKLLDYGFSHFVSRRIVQKGDEVGRLLVPGAAGEVAVRAAADLWAAVPLGAPSPAERVLLPADDAVAPVAADAVVGRLALRDAGGKEIGSVPVTVAAAVAAAPVSVSMAAALDAGGGTGVRFGIWLLVAGVGMAGLWLMIRRRRRSL
ncbi:MAG: Serine-type D-Ala-D-Ala carboxypeptidase [Symbiobacteriaceae bacterium]|jgi:D-alanyl-D-alanine carboxypeptidase (penicillin-binding protein 5/6)|nr:Serine-type D-Ala-D-Ala carboxypeptidase [Symbiobacteriaceae bacterium]